MFQVLLEFIAGWLACWALPYGGSGAWSLTLKRGGWTKTRHRDVDVKSIVRPYSADRKYLLPLSGCFGIRREQLLDRHLGFDSAAPEPFVREPLPSCLGSLSCRKVNLLPRTWWHFSALIFASTFTGPLLRSLPTVERMFFVGMCSVEGTLMAKKLNFRLD